MLCSLNPVRTRAEGAYAEIGSEGQGTASNGVRDMDSDLSAQPLSILNLTESPLELLLSGSHL